MDLRLTIRISHRLPLGRDRKCSGFSATPRPLSHPRADWTLQFLLDMLNLISLILVSTEWLTTTGSGDQVPKSWFLDFHASLVQYTNFPPGPSLNILSSEWQKAGQGWKCFTPPSVSHVSLSLINAPQVRLKLVPSQSGAWHWL